MIKKYISLALCVYVMFFFAQVAFSKNIKGIYVTQWTLENTAYLNYLIKNAKQSGINTFIIDLEAQPSKRYRQNIELVRQNGLQFIARIVIFPGGGTAKQIETPEIWQKKYALVEQAIALGASQIQLDYIRYNTKQKASQNNAQNILRIIEWYKHKIAEHRLPLQIDVFGETSFGESKHIGQNIKLFAQAVDAICPMVYPSHYVPYPWHFKHPAETVYNSLKGIKDQFANRDLPMKVIAYIELSNYHYPMSREKTRDYIEEQIKAVKTAGADGWYAWSPHNRYDNLFHVLKSDPSLH